VEQELVDNIHEMPDVLFGKDKVLRNSLVFGVQNNVLKKRKAAWESKTVLLTLEKTCSFSPWQSHGQG
jgi:hypothetical protein